MKNRAAGTWLGTHAFTLVELLLVVLILALLTAISVPNLLTAQTRAKVSRAHADLRTAVVAIESYHTDQSRYMDISAGFLQEESWMGLTTPVSYLGSTTCMRDVFGPWYDQGNPDPGRCYAYLPFSRLAESPLLPAANIHQAMKSHYGPYAVASIGPARVNAWEEYTSTITLMLRYDPSNGTNSIGLIVHAPKIKN